MHRISLVTGLAIAVTTAAALVPAHAGNRLLATGGVTQLEGSAGGGLTPWALIAGLGTDRQIGGSAFCTRVRPDDFQLTSCGAAVGIRDRVELSYARQEFNLGNTVPGQSIRVDVVGAKVRVLGDAVYDQDNWLPQVALGMQYKDNKDYDLVPRLLGARDDSSIDWYASATKVWLDGPFSRFALANLTLRYSNANQLGILGFGGDRSASRSLLVEGSVATFLTDSLVLGVEYRQKPDKLSVFKEDDFKDVFLAYFPAKWTSVTAAYADLGNIANEDDQRGWYLSLQVGF